LENNWARSLSAKILCHKIIRAVNSTEYCGCLFDEGDIGIRLGGGGGHSAMIPLRQMISPFAFVLKGLVGSDMKQRSAPGVLQAPFG